MSETAASAETAASPDTVAPEPPAASPPESTRTGPGRLLVAVYGLFALSACARAGTQIATEFSRAPAAYVLSAIAGVVYIVATVTLVNGSPTARRIAFISCSSPYTHRSRRRYRKTIGSGRLTGGPRRPSTAVTGDVAWSPNDGDPTRPA